MTENWIVLLTRQDKKVRKNIERIEGTLLVQEIQSTKNCFNQKESKGLDKGQSKEKNQLVWIIIRIFLYSYFSLFNLYLIVLRYFCFITLFRTMIRICFDVFDSASRRRQIFNFQDIFVSFHCSSFSNDKVSFKRHKFKVILKSRKCRFDVNVLMSFWHQWFGVVVSTLLEHKKKLHFDVNDSTSLI